MTTRTGIILIIGFFLTVLLKAQVNPTNGWTQMSSTYIFHTPPNVPQNQRYNYDAATNTHHLWVFQTDSPRFANTAPRCELRFQQEWTSGLHQFEADVKVASGTDESSIIQIFGGSGGHATAFMMWGVNENGGAFKRYNSQVLQTGMYDKWYHINIIHDADANKVNVYIDNVLKLTHPDWGDNTHYFKCGVYGVKGAKSETWLRNIKYWIKTNNIAPDVSITSPANNASFTNPASITINANASDPDGTIAKVEFFNGSIKLGDDNSAPYSFAWTNVGVGTYSLTVRATDNQGASKTSSVVKITVDPATTSVQDNHRCAAVRIFPNPVKNRMHFSFDLAPGILHTIIISDALGKEVKRITGTENPEEISAEDLTDGLYFYTVTSGNGAINNGKLIVSH